MSGDQITVAHHGLQLTLRVLLDSDVPSIAATLRQHGSLRMATFACGPLKRTSISVESDDTVCLWVNGASFDLDRRSTESVKHFVAKARGDL